MTGLAIQLFTFRALDQSPVETLEYLATTPYEGVEFAGLAGVTADRVRETLDATGLDPVGAHVPHEALDVDYEGVVERYRALGVDRLVVPTYDRTAFETESGVRAAAAHLSGLADRLADDGVDLLYHTHSFEFADVGGRPAVDLFTERLDGRVGLEFDTGLARYGGRDPVDLLDRYGDCSPQVHLTDTVPGSDDTRHVDLGTGVVDVESCVHAATAAGADWLVFEHGRTGAPVAAAESAARVVRPILTE